ncbi:DNA alkylation repair protein [Paenibacillus selenitireducens]|uniref:DNA alkylation repair protein n=1 Tax=Paenibacillus selenitireducens TaxID=1324314 RepID=A0A1T2XN17_9BACL|nr:DNA alkylation repair protein [Paenibacillus selenitireducens]OPA81251.1 DNA alkylation repair protein [Paenibacillus selenitireducens]
MTLEEVMQQLEAMGTEQTKSTYIRHGAQEPFFGVKIGDMKKLVKFVKKDQELALALYDTGNYDAMYLAGLTVDPKLMTKDKLQAWVQQANWHALAEYTVANVAAETPFVLELAREWIQSPDELVATCGWSTFASYAMITPDELLDLEELRQLLGHIENVIHTERNRVRYTMNSFVIAVGTTVKELHVEAMQVAEKIGKVSVEMGKTACKVPLASEYMKKVEAKGNLGIKRKTCIC